MATNIGSYANLGRAWHDLNNPSFGPLAEINAIFRKLDLTALNRLPILHNGSCLFLGSDYSPVHRLSDYESFGFICTSSDAFARWLETQNQFRKQFLKDGRRISYKGLGDRKVAEILSRFLAFCDRISGLLTVFSVHKSILSLFSASMHADYDPMLPDFRKWKPHVFEKFQRTSAFAGLLLAGLSREGQNVLWITDQDEMLANEARHRQFVSGFSIIASNLLNHTLGHLRIATTSSDTGKRDLEDFVAIADLAVGAMSEILTQYRRREMPLSRLILPPPSQVSAKTRMLMNWLSDERPQLKRVFFSIDPIPGSNALSINHISLVGEKM